MTPLALLAVGGAPGDVLRQLTSVSLAGRGRVPLSVLVDNTVGSFITGVVFGATLHHVYTSL